jgi:hypothetical protein
LFLEQVDLEVIEALAEALEGGRQRPRSVRHLGLAGASHGFGEADAVTPPQLDPPQVRT